MRNRLVDETWYIIDMGFKKRRFVVICKVYTIMLFGRQRHESLLMMMYAQLASSEGTTIVEKMYLKLLGL